MNQPQTLEQWASWFQAEFAPSGLDAPGTLSFMRHFVDLGILEAQDGNRWQLAGVDGSPTVDEVREAVREKLDILSRRDEGFAVAYFLGQRPPLSPGRDESSRSRMFDRDPLESQIPERQAASDLSNLQIVKKVGRQLKPFLDFEKATVARLQGPHTQAQDAKTIFNFILRQTRQKAEPKQWEQLSRKRHK